MRSLKNLIGLMKFLVYVFTDMLHLGTEQPTFSWEVGGAGVRRPEIVPFLCSSIFHLLTNTTVTTLKSLINGICAGP